jgi:hypothetical protein
MEKKYKMVALGLLCCFGESTNVAYAMRSLPGKNFDFSPRKLQVAAKQPSGSGRKSYLKKSSARQLQGKNFSAVAGSEVSLNAPQKPVIAYAAKSPSGQKLDSKKSALLQPQNRNVAHRKPSDRLGKTPSGLGKRSYLKKPPALEEKNSEVERLRTDIKKGLDVLVQLELEINECLLALNRPLIPISTLESLMLMLPPVEPVDDLAERVDVSAEEAGPQLVREEVPEMVPEEVFVVKKRKNSENVAYNLENDFKVSKDIIENFAEMIAALKTNDSLTVERALDSIPKSLKILRHIPAHAVGDIDYLIESVTGLEGKLIIGGLNQTEVIQEARTLVEHVICMFLERSNFLGEKMHSSSKGQAQEAKVKDILYRAAIIVGGTLENGLERIKNLMRSKIPTMLRDGTPGEIMLCVAAINALCDEILANEDDDSNNSDLIHMVMEAVNKEMPRLVAISQLDPGKAREAQIQAFVKIMGDHCGINKASAMSSDHKAEWENAWVQVKNILKAYFQTLGIEGQFTEAEVTAMAAGFLPELETSTDW